MYKETVAVEFLGGSQDGALLELDEAPEYLAVRTQNGPTEIYERQNDERPPFVYIQTGYAEGPLIPPG